MLTKYILTIGATEHVVPEECLMNWDEISFSLKRTDYSGVMRSYSTQFVFVGDIRDLLWEHYLANGFNAEAKIAVYTLTNTHEWEKQYEAPLDFSSLENEQGKLTMNAIDNSLAAKIKANKSQKYEFLVDDLSHETVKVNRLEMSNEAVFDVDLYGHDHTDWVDMLYNEANSAVITQDYFEMYDEISAARQDHAVNRFFAKCVKRGASMTLRIEFTIKYPLFLSNGNVPPIGTIYLNKWYVNSQDQNVVETLATICNNNISDKVVGLRTTAYSSLAALMLAKPHPQHGDFGIVGSNDYSHDPDDFLDNNTVYEYDSSTHLWVDKGSPRLYAQYRTVSKEVSVSWGDIYIDDELSLGINNSIEIYGGNVYLFWTDPSEFFLVVKGIRPVDLGTALIQAIEPTASVTIDADSAGLLADTMILCGEAIRDIPGCKVYSTFNQFADWMEAVFGYTYNIVGDVVQFVHRSAVFDTTNTKTIESFNEFKYAVNDKLIYSQVEAGYPKKEYGEIDGRYETNFTNYYSTGCSLTDNKLSLISKYRSDAYGIEYSARKRNKASTDDKADEDVFFVYAPVVSSYITYDIGNNDAYNPSVCVENNKGYIAAVGNGAAVVLKMTSSDGDNTLANVTIAAGSNLFTAGEVEFTTDDMVPPADLNGLVQLDYKGYRYKGFIGELNARYGRENGYEYKLIVKEITEL